MPEENITFEQICLGLARIGDDELEMVWARMFLASLEGEITFSSGRRRHTVNASDLLDDLAVMEYMAKTSPNKRNKYKNYHVSPKHREVIGAVVSYVCNFG